MRMLTLPAPRVPSRLESPRRVARVGASIGGRRDERLVARGGDVPDLSAVVPGFRTATGSAISRGSPSGSGYVADLGVDAVWLSPIFTSPMARHGLRRLATIPTSTRSSARWPTSTPWSRGRTSWGSRSSSTRCCRTPRTSIPSSPRAGRAATTPRPTGTSGPTRSTTARRPTTGCRSSAAPAWAWDARRHQYYLHNFLAEQPDFNFHNPEVRKWLLSTMRFWLERGVDGFRLDTVNFYFHDALLRDDPADFRRKTQPEANPYGMQYHLFSKNQPENLAVPRGDAAAPRRVRGARDGRRDGREPPRDPDDGRVHHRQAAA